MSGISIAFLILAAAALVCVPRRFAPAVMLAGLFYLTKGQGLELGSVTLHSHRLLFAVGVLRAVARSEGIRGPLTPLDKMVLVSGLWTLVASFFHEQAAGSGVTYTLGGTFNWFASYFLMRAWIRDLDDLRTMIAGWAILLAPIGVVMWIEKITGRNPMVAFGGLAEVIVRDGMVRSRGPFRHPILAGTVAAAAVPLLVGIWREQRKIATIGLGACFLVISACHSSGPVVSLMAVIGLTFAWRWRRYVKHSVWAFVIGYLLLEVISNRPAFHAIVTRLDFTGSSTAYYRCRLIDTTLRHIHEWWLYGTDYTAHWIPSNIGSIVLDGKHIDITNFYIASGVNAGLLAIILLVATIIIGLRQTIAFAKADPRKHPFRDRYLMWCLGVSFGSLAISGLSVSFYDQSGSLIWITAAAIASTGRLLRQPRAEAAAEKTKPAPGWTPPVAPKPRLGF